ncbi:hypothetical protein LENED_005885 [Lentinula edodes]|uniref:Uncharacterized protein n=2 Tax=Lentinula edodes TaxID=5353 RepID=A0A1Q3EA76_LENED|nr:hypothetical protein LENED_005885 [Lentinula edodes]
MKNHVPPYHGVFPNEMITTDVSSLWKRTWIDETKDTYEKMKVFAEDVGGYLPYVAVKSVQTYEFHGVLMDDERIIGIKRNHVLSGVESIEVIHMG